MHTKLLGIGLKKFSFTMMKVFNIGLTLAIFGQSFAKPMISSKCPTYSFNWSPDECIHYVDHGHDDNDNSTTIQKTTSTSSSTTTTPTTNTTATPTTTTTHCSGFFQKATTFKSKIDLILCLTFFNFERHYRVC